MQKCLAAGEIFRMKLQYSDKWMSGQGLIEVLMTVLFIGIAVLALVRFQNYLGYNNAEAAQRIDAIIIAEKQIETLRDFQVLNNTSGYTSYQGIASGTGSATGAGVSYSISWTVTTNANPVYKTISVTVTWTDRYNVSQSVNLVTDVAGIEPSQSSSIM